MVGPNDLRENGCKDVKARGCYIFSNQIQWKKMIILYTKVWSRTCNTWSSGWNH